MHSEGLRLFGMFWWLIFPLFWMVAALLRMNQRHDQSNRILDLIKHYADQGKEVPPELLRALDKPDQGPWGRDGDWGKRRHSWTGVFLFAALCAGFLLFAFWPGIGWDAHQTVGFLFAALVMAGLCIGNLVAVVAQNRQKTPPQ
jgi:hypothetical protein